MAALEPEQIYLSSDDEDGQDDTARDPITHRELVQRSRLKGYRVQFGLFNDRYLSICTTKTGRKPLEFWLDLRHLDAQPKRVIRIAWRWWLVCGISCVAAVLLGGYIRASGSGLFSHPAFTAALATAGLGAFTLLVAVHLSSRKLVWFTRHGRIGLVEMMTARPSRAEVRRFVQEIVERAQRAQSTPELSPTRLLSGELREHRRLHEEGILPLEMYERAKARILRCHG